MTSIIGLLCSAFFAVLFLQSGLDKALNRPGNLVYFTEVTAKGPLARWPRAALNLVTVMELLAGCASAAGVLLWFKDGTNPLMPVGSALAALNLLVLFAGQRLARDYAGAAGLVPYFLVALVALFAQG